MRRLLLAVLVSAMLLPALQAQKARRPRPPAPKGAYVPDPKGWKLFVLTPVGGWTTAKALGVEVRVVDPKDPNPPKEVARGYEDPDLEGEGDEDFTPPPRTNEAWRRVNLHVWINGQFQVREILVGRKSYLHIPVQDGENRLEIRQYDCNARAVRTFWGANSRDRLSIRLLDETPVPSRYHGGWWWSGLQVVEPDSTESIGGEPTPSGGRNSGRAYTHAAPLPGTYTLRWFDTRAGVDGYGYDEGYESYGELLPQKVICEVLLDQGTDRERRWRFERLVIPGTKRVTLGSFDVED